MGRLICHCCTIDSFCVLGPIETSPPIELPTELPIEPIVDFEILRDDVPQTIIIVSDSEDDDPKGDLDWIP